MSPLENQTLALAGMFQSAVLIEQLAYKGEVNQAAFDCSVDSLFAFNAENTLEIFGDVFGLNRGMQALTNHLGGRGQASGKNLAYYIMSMMKVSTNLLKDEAMANRLQNELQTIQQQSIDFEMSRNNTINKIDGLYQNTISKAQSKVIIRGEQIYLSNNDTAAKVRTLLLAGIRAAVLWHQLGGSKWKLIISRKKYVESAKRFMSNL
jgi:high frequency lysogenization protein